MQGGAVGEGVGIGVGAGVGGMLQFAFVPGSTKKYKLN